MKRHVAYDEKGNDDHKGEDPYDERARELGFVIHPDEKRYMDRLDRKDGQHGSTKRTKTAAKAVRPKTALEREPRTNQAFDSTRTKEEKEYNEMLDDMLPKRRQNRIFEGNEAAIKKALYGSADVVLHKPIDLLEMHKGSDGVLHFLTPVMRKKISQFDLYDQAETKLRPIDFQWNRGNFEESRYPAGKRVSLAAVADFVENNTGLDVWSFEMLLPNNVESTPEWVLDNFYSFIEHEESKPEISALVGRISLTDSVQYVGLMALDLILDPESLFHMRLLYAYGTLKEDAPRGAAVNFPAGLIKHEEYLRILEAAKVTKGDSRFRLERHAVMRSEPINPVFNIPATYIGRYYFSPMPAENLESNSLENRLKENAKLWDTRPLFDEVDMKNKDKS